MNDKYIYLVFSKTGTWLSKIINLFTETKYIHSTISFDNSFKEMYSFGRTNPDNPFSGGFVIENLSEGVYKKFKQSECIIYRVRVTEEEFNELKNEVHKFLVDMHKYRYNFLGLIAVLFNISVRRKNYYFCSQFVCEVLMKSNIYKCHKSPELTRPNDLLSIEDKELIYEGFINEYSVSEELCTFTS